jgi:hypothetical protein
MSGTLGRNGNVHSPESSISRAVALYFWASDFATILNGDLLGILGKAYVFGQGEVAGDDEVFDLGGVAKPRECEMTKKIEPQSKVI